MIKIFAQILVRDFSITPSPLFCITYQEDEKEKLIQETGLELKQVNNWFINQRKRNWHS
jgi:hypothetical protein